MSAWICSLTQILRNSRLISMRATITVKWGDMEPGQMVTVPYSMMVRGDVKSGFFPIHYLVTYREEEGGEFSGAGGQGVFYVRVKGKDDDELSADAGEQGSNQGAYHRGQLETIPAEDLCRTAV